MGISHLWRWCSAPNASSTHKRKWRDRWWRQSWLVVSEPELDSLTSSWVWFKSTQMDIIRLRFLPENRRGTVTDTVLCPFKTPAFIKWKHLPRVISNRSLLKQYMSMLCILLHCVSSSFYLALVDIFWLFHFISSSTTNSLPDVPSSTKKRIYIYIHREDCGKLH